MSVDLVNLSFKQTGLSSSEHSVLNVLAYRAGDETYECWPSIKSLCESTSLNEKTVQACLLSLISKNKIFDTGKRSGKTKRVIVYRMIFNTPNIGCVQNLNTPYFSDNTPKIGGVKYPQNRGSERSLLKDKGKKGFSLSLAEKQERDWYLKNPHMPIKKEHEYLFSKDGENR